MKTICIRGGRVIDPSQNLDRIQDVWIVHRKIAGPREVSQLNADITIDARGKLVFPGLIDMQVHLREPGSESDETIASGANAALESGITSLATMADTDPAVDNQASVEFVILQAKRAECVTVFPIGSVSKARRGKELAEMGGMVRAGAVAFSDAPEPIDSAELMRRALEYSKMFDRPILSHPEVKELTNNGIMHEGMESLRLGLPGIPRVAETIMVERDLQLARFTGGRLHLQNLSCAESIEAVRRAKKQGLHVTCQVAAHHLLLTESDMRDYDSIKKVNPPLRTEADRQAIIQGIVDGTIDAISSAHSPRAPEQKLRELDTAPFGVIGIETLLPVVIESLIKPQHLTWLKAIACLSTNPSTIFKLQRGSLLPGSIADVTVYDPDATWKLTVDTIKSKSRNSPFIGRTFSGKATAVIVNGEVRHEI